MKILAILIGLAALTGCVHINNYISGGGPDGHVPRVQIFTVIDDNDTVEPNTNISND